MLVPTMFSTTNAFATDIGSEGGMRYWTAEQLIKLNDELEAEKDSRCASDLACEREFYDELRMSDSVENNLLDMFNGFRILATRINPSTESVHLLYRDTDAMMRQFGETERQILNEFHLVWLDPSMPDPMSDFSYMNNGHPLFVDEIHENNLSDGVHLLLTKTVAKDGQNWISPNEEVEFATDSDVLSSNTTNKIYYAAKIGTWQTHNYFDYGECLNSPTYRPGMECRYVFYEDFTRGYLPFEVEVASPEAPIESTEETETSEPISKDSQAAETEIVTSQAAVTSETSTAPVISTSIIRVPEYIAVAQPSDTKDTQTNREDKEEAKLADSAESANALNNYNPDDYVEVPLAASNKSTEFPWWLLIFAFSGVAIVVFWFMLIRNKMSDD